MPIKNQPKTKQAFSNTQTLTHTWLPKVVISLAELSALRLS